MLGRLINVIKSWFGEGLEMLEDPALVFNQFQRDLAALHAKNRRRAVLAITQMNNLQRMVDDTQQKGDLLQTKAELAKKLGDYDRANSVLIERQHNEVALNELRENLRQAAETAARVEAGIEEEMQAFLEQAARSLAALSRSSDRMRLFNDLQIQQVLEAEAQKSKLQWAAVVQELELPKTCRYCAETIKAAATVCRYCGRDV
jgi:phage shock protein A